MTPQEIQDLKDLIKQHGARAPGHLRARIDALLPTLTSRAETSDWLQRQSRLHLTDTSPRIGKMIFPVIMSGNISGALITFQAASSRGGDRDLESVSGARVRRWLVRTLAQLLTIDASVIELRLSYVPMTWWFGVEGAPQISGEFPPLVGESMDLAIALALTGYLIQRVPHGAWVVSGALGLPGRVGVVGHCVEKLKIVRIEAPNVRSDQCVLADTELEFDPLLRRVYGDDVINALAGAFDQSATALLDQANAAWNGRDEHNAASLARSALAMTTSPGQLARARLILAADAVHRGTLDEAARHFDALEIAVSNATRAHGWVRDDMREVAIRMAGADLDRLAPTDAKNLVAPVIEALKSVLEEHRSARWNDLMAQAKGTLSRIHLLEGDLDAAIAMRREAIADGPEQERARSRLALATLLFLKGERDDAAIELARARDALVFLAAGPARQLTARFVRVAQTRWGLLHPSVQETRAAFDSAPELSAWPQPAEVIATILAASDESLALTWFDKHIFSMTAPPHPAYIDFLVTACARAVASGFDSPRWREGPVHLVDAIAKTSADAGRVAILRAFVEGGDTTPVIQGCLY